MRIFFIGSVEFSYKSLTKVLEIGGNVVGVATRQLSCQNADFKDLTPIAESYKIPSKYVENINEDINVSWIASLKPDVIFCFGWSNLLKSDILKIARLGVVGYHPAGIPFNRGRHPLIWSIVLGLEQTASTFFIMDEGADSGDILSQEKFDILYSDDARTVYDKMTKVALSQIEKFVPQLAKGNYSLSKQDHSKANLWRKRGFKDGLIDFRMSSRSIYNLVRALTIPYVGASIIVNGEEIKVWKVAEQEFNEINIEPGKVLDVNKREVTVKTGDGAICILEHNFEKIPLKGSYL